MRRRAWWFGGAALLLAGAALLWWSLSAEENAEAHSVTSPSATGLSTDDAEPRLRFDRKPSVWEAAVEPKGELILTGRVLDERGSPVVAASVTATALHGDDVLSDQQCKCDNECGQKLLECGCPEASGQLVEHVSSRTGEAQPLARATSDATGTFTLRGLSSGTVALWADAPGMIGFRASANVGDVAANIAVESGRMIRGKVNDGRDQPVDSALVTAIFATHSRFFDATTLSDGTFVIGPLPASGTVAVVAMKDGLMPDSAHARARDGADVDDPDAELNLALHEPRTLSGVVVRDGEPVGPGIEVKVEGEHKKKKTRTNDEGAFSVRGLRPGKYELSASDHGDLASLDAKVDRTLDKVDVKLELLRATIIRGTVKDVVGDPIVDSALVAWGAGDTFRTKSGSAGTFELAVARRGAWTISAGAHGFLDQTVSKTVAGDLEVDFVLERAVEVNGMVSDESGRPVAGAQLSATSSDDLPGFADSTATTDGGVFSLNQMRPGTFELLAVADGFLATTVKITAPADGLTVVLSDGATVSGTVTESDGRPVQGAHVYAAPGRSDDGVAHVDYGRKRVLSDDEGRFEIRGLKHGPHTLTALVFPRSGRHPSTSRSASTTVDLARIDSTQAHIVFPRTVQITGVVTDEAGGPLPGVKVSATPVAETADSYASNAGDSDGDGNFVIPALNEGAYELSASKEGYVPVDNLKARAAQVGVRIVLKAAPVIKGRVVAEDGEAIKDFTVNRSRKVTTDGRFSLPVLAKGETDVDFEADGYAQLRVKVPAFSGKKDLGDVTLSRGRTVSGAVVDAITGAPVDGALVDVSTHNVDSDSFYLAEKHGAVRTDGRGQFQLPRVDPKAVRIVATHDDFRPLVQPLEPSQTNVVLSMVSGASVEFTVLDRNDKPARGMVLSQFRRFVRSEDASGKFLVKGLKPGVAEFAFWSEARPQQYFRPQRVVSNGNEALKVTWREATDGATVTLKLTNGDLSKFRAFLVQGRESAALPYRQMWQRGGEHFELRDGAFKHVLAGGYALVLSDRATNEYMRVVVDVTAEPVQGLTVAVPAKLELLAEDVP